VELLLEVLDDPLAYLGMIGSRRRIRAVFELLERQRGIPATDLTGSMPRIGLEIGAETPAEIAVAILAELIAVAAAAPGRRAERTQLSRSSSL
jgi:xanthine dehydrogenase accessory factor